MRARICISACAYVPARARARARVCVLNLISARARIEQMLRVIFSKVRVLVKSSSKRTCARLETVRLGSPLCGSLAL